MPKRGNLVDERLDGTSSRLFGNPKQVFVIFMGMNYSRHLLTVGQKEKKVNTDPKLCVTWLLLKLPLATKSKL